jgi:formylglycine-generating enzyme required for sulfatase activity
MAMLLVTIVCSACGLIAGLTDKELQRDPQTAGSGSSTGEAAGSGGTAGGTTLPPPSCETHAPGAGYDCGIEGEEDCCESPLVSGGGFFRFHDENNPATVSTFRLDRFEVTVARFRAFQQAVDDGYRPAEGSGKRLHLEGGAAVGELGWFAAWDEELEVSIQTCPSNNYTSAPSANDHQPINCTSYYQAVAFCIWDRGFLPTSAELLYVLVGGKNRQPDQRYPWGNELDPTRAVYDGLPLADVGSKVDGEGYLRHNDIIGNVSEIVVDNDWIWEGTRCVQDCAYFDDSVLRVYALGGSRETPQADIESDSSVEFHREGRADVGFRCARAP